MTRLLFAVTALLGLASPALALNILLSNDDGLTSNLRALHDSLRAEGHDVIVSVPCTGQSGRAAAIVMYSTSVIVPDNDKTQVEAEGGCHNGAAPTGAPAVGPFLKPGYTGGDYYYVHGTPVTATLYGLDVLAPARWGQAPDVVLSGPNEGQNVGRIINSSGTVGNAQLAAARGLPAIALSAGTDTVDDVGLANSNSATVAQLTLKLLKSLQATCGNGPLLPVGLALNVNFPKAPTPTTPFAFARIGTFDLYNLQFKRTVPYGLGITLNPVTTATPEQREDESLVSQSKVSVAAMQVGFEANDSVQRWLRGHLRQLSNPSHHPLAQHGRQLTK